VQKTARGPLTTIVLDVLHILPGYDFPCSASNAQGLIPTPLNTTSLNEISPTGLTYAFLNCF